MSNDTIYCLQTPFAHLSYAAIPTFCSIHGQTPIKSLSITRRKMETPHMNIPLDLDCGRYHLPSSFVEDLSRETNRYSPVWCCHIHGMYIEASHLEACNDEKTVITGQMQ